MQKSKRINVCTRLELGKVTVGAPRLTPAGLCNSSNSSLNEQARLPLHRKYALAIRAALRAGNCHALCETSIMYNGMYGEVLLG